MYNVNVTTMALIQSYFDDIQEVMVDSTDNPHEFVVNRIKELADTLVTVSPKDSPRLLFELSALSIMASDVMSTVMKFDWSDVTKTQPKESDFDSDGNIISAYDPEYCDPNLSGSYTIGEIVTTNVLAGKLWKRTDLWWKENQIDFLVGKV